MGELDDLYQEVILDHYRQPRNFGPLAGANRHAIGDNPLDVIVESDVIKEIKFQGTGCAISTASASLMTASVKGRTTRDVTVLFEAFHKMVTGTGGAGEELGKLAAFAGVSEFPVRVKCASLCWHTLKAAIENKDGKVTTE